MKILNVVFALRISLILTFSFLLLLGLVSGCATTNPLHDAIVRKDTKEAKLLIRKNPDTIWKKNDKGITPLFLAANYGREEVVQALLEAGADPNVYVNNTTALIEASYDGMPTLVGLLIQHGATVNAPASHNGWTSLHYAANRNHFSVVKILINGGANELVEKDGLTPLMLASNEGHTVIAEYLLLQGADPNRQNKDGMTSLMKAVLGGHKKIAELLIQNGADTDIQSKIKMTAKDYASANNLTELTELFGGIQSGNTLSKSKVVSGPLIILKTHKAQLDGEEILKASGRAWELRPLIGRFLDLLRENIHASRIDVFDGSNKNKKAFFLSLIIDENQDAHRGSNAAKGFVSGFFTLGLVKPSGDYSYTTTITLIAERPDGQQKTYRASSDINAEWKLETAQKSGATARRQVTLQALESLISQIKADQGFFMK